jgi:peptide deformylase
LLNPKIIKKIGKHEDIEGCLSYPGYQGTVSKTKRVVVSGMNEKGKLVQYEAEGFMARAVCHETDHLDEYFIWIKRKKCIGLKSKSKQVK